MAAPLPHGLIRVVSATQTEGPSDPADIIFERQRALHKFWKVHDAQSRATRDPANIRCRQLFWRVWGNKRLSLLEQDTMLQLWMQCQRPFDMSPFILRINSSQSSNSNSNYSSTSEGPARRSSKDSQITDSLSPSQIITEDDSSEEIAESNKRPLKEKQRPKASSRSSTSRPVLGRKSSSGDPTQKRNSSSTTTTKAKTRPSINRKRSSNSNQPTELLKPRKSIIKSPRTSQEDQTSPQEPRRSNSTVLKRATTNPTSPLELPERKISVFELPSASSWQSVESHDHASNRSTTLAGLPTMTTTTPSLVDKNFRERFTEQQKQLRSSTNLADMNRVMKKTGSVVRFADDVEAAQEVRKLMTGSRRSEGEVVRSATLQLPSNTRDGSSSRSTQGQIPSPTSPGLQHRDSVGSVAAVSDDSDEEEGISMLLPRTRSQLSLGIADLKRSQSTGDGDVVTSPQIEQEQEALISGKGMKKRSEEEENLLAMGRKDGVTKAGGINFPKELRVRDSRDVKDKFEEPEQPLF